MPNRCSNYFTANSDDTDLMAQLHDALINEHNQLDYNLAFRMPPELDTPRWTITVIPDWASKEQAVLERFPNIKSEERLVTKSKEEIDAYISNAFKSIQRESENKAIIEKYWTDSWYDRSINNRWCKWNCLDDVGDVLNDDHTEITISFDSPRSPPSWWFEKLCQLFPTVFMTLEFEEPWMWFEWTIQSTWDWGTITEDREYTPQCEQCWEKIEGTARDEDLDCDICPDCKQDIRDESHFDEDKISSPSESVKLEHMSQ